MEKFCCLNELSSSHGGQWPNDYSSLVSRLSSPGLSPARDIKLFSWVRYFTLKVPLSTQVYKYNVATREFNAGGNPAMD